MTLKVFASGQSNMIGRGLGGPPWSAIDSRVTAWNNTNPLGANGTSFVTPTLSSVTFDPSDGNNLAVWFCHRLAQIRAVAVQLTMVAQGGLPISAWAPGGSPPMLQECIDVWAATGQGPADIFLWHQGETDLGVTSAAAYKTAFLALLANLTTAGVINSSTTVIIGGIYEKSSAEVTFNASTLKAIANTTPNVFYAAADGLTDRGDALHFSGQSLYTHGAARYFAAYMEAKGLDMADLWALVNEGGTPGSPGTGANKLYNLLNLALLGMGHKDTTLSADFTGTPPVDKLLTAAMLAGGAIVDWGTDATNGYWFRWESGLQICAAAMTLAFSTASSLQVPWTFAKPFVSVPFVVMASNSSVAYSGAAPLNTTKRGGSLPDVNTNTTTGVTIRMSSASLYVTGDTWGANAIAVGFWK